MFYVVFWQRFGIQLIEFADFGSLILAWLIFFIFFIFFGGTLRMND